MAITTLTTANTFPQLVAKTNEISSHVNTLDVRAEPITWRGSWYANVVYMQNDTVSHGTAIWISRGTNINTTPSALASATWNQMIDATNGGTVQTVLSVDSANSSQMEWSPTGILSTDSPVAGIVDTRYRGTLVLRGMAGATAGRQILLSNLHGNTSLANTGLIIIEHNHAGASHPFMIPDHVPLLVMPGDAVNFHALDTSYWRYSGQPKGWRDRFEYFTDFTGELVPYSSASTSTTSGHWLGVDWINQDANTTVSATITESNPFNSATKHWSGVACFQSGNGKTSSTMAKTNPYGGASIARGPTLFMVRLSLSALSNSSQGYIVSTGFHGSLSATNPADCIAWRYVHSASPYWIMSTRRTGSANTNTASTLTASALGDHWLGIYINHDWTRADFIHSTDGAAWTVAGSSTSGIPTAASISAYTIPAGIALHKLNGTTPVSMYCDFIGMRQLRNRG
jgi:hypothetical protein